MNQVNFDNWKAHCHYLGELMTPAKGKPNAQKYAEANASFDKKWDELNALKDKNSKTAQKLEEQIAKLSLLIDKLEPVKNMPHLSAGCKSRLNQVYTEVTTGRKKHIKSKFLEKGLLLEEDAITAYSQFTGEFHKKNKLRVENDYLTGEMDFEFGDIALDTKVSWDIFTFDAVRFKPIDTNYKWQLLGYCWLYGKERGRLVYTLLNTPEFLIQAEERKLMYEMFGSESQKQLAPPEMIQAYEEEITELRKLHIHDDLPLERKIKLFNIVFQSEAVDKIKTVIEGCRWYLNNIEIISEEEEVEEDE